MKVFFRMVSGVMGFWLVSFSLVKAASPIIVITNMPAFGTYGANCFISGYVTNVNTATNCLFICDYWPNENPSPSYDKKLSPWGWFSRPTFAHPLTLIQPDGSWSCNMPSNFDQYATEYAVMLVPTNFSQPYVNAASGLPIADINASKAIVYADRVNPNRRAINWAGYSWWVKTAGADGNEFLGETGPGPNYYSDSTNNAWVDAQGLLHLQITHTNGAWECVELFSDESFGYGQYRCTLNANISNLDANVIFSMFTWSDDTDYNDREIDMEVSRWDYAFGSNNVEDYAISPYNNGQTLRFGLPPNVTNSTHIFTWTPSNVIFQTMNGNYSSSPAPSNILESWTCTAQPIPPQGGENVLLILWLYHGNPPLSGQPVQVTLSDFKFVPWGTPQPALLTQPTWLSNRQFQFGIEGVPQAHYQIQSSSNLLNWLTNGPAIRATNSIFSSSPLPATFQFTDTNPPSSAPSFYRVVTEP
ncbi:MAG TPA: hypothetical protein VHG71_11065 [Verrucomicrobiae bacterium]|nr:hypothetical protein [Verrucomicrobiae bacterium]